MATRTPTKKAATATPLLSICIPTHDHPLLLKNCLTHLEKAKALFPTLEVVVLDSSEGDASKKVAAGFSFVTYHHLKGWSAPDKYVSGFLHTTGKYTLYMGDDDYLILDKMQEVLQFLEAHPDVVAYYAPWNTWDDQTQAVTGKFFNIPESKTYTTADSLDLLNCLLQHHVYPEIFIARTDVLARVVHVVPDSYSQMIWLVEFLRYGAIHLAAEPFYLQTEIFKPEFQAEKPSAAHSLGVQLCLSNAEMIRRGIEYAAARLFHHIGILQGSPEVRQALEAAITNYYVARLFITARQAGVQGHYANAVEYYLRASIFAPSANLDMSKTFQSWFGVPATCAAVLDRVSKLIDTNGVRLVNFQQAGVVRDWFHKVDPKASVEVASLPLSKTQKGQHLYLVTNESDASQLQKEGTPRRQILNINDVANQFKVLPYQNIQIDVFS